MKLNKYGILVACTGLLFSCTKLNEEFRGEIEQGNTSSINVSNLLQGSYDALNFFQTQDQIWAAQEQTSDETIGPTRGPDWDDNGVWRVLHAHQWNPDHAFLRNTFTSLLQAQFAASNVLAFNPSAQQSAEARFIRAFSIFMTADGWDQVPYRDDVKDFNKLPTTLKGSEANDFVISEVTAIMNDLPDGPTYKASKNAARVLLMKAYLNKGAFANRQSPTFAASDMNQVIALADQIISSNKYSLQPNFFENFAPNNDVLSKENIWTLQNIGGQRGGNARFEWFCTLHYNQNPSGWNGFTTLSDFYDKFGATDTRKGITYPGQKNYSGAPPPVGNTVGFYVGQQYDQSGTALKDRRGNPLAFTREVQLKETGSNLEVTGIRVVKYPIDYVSGDQADNDYVIFRYADVLLMKAEAIMRGGTATTAGAVPNTPMGIVNYIRAARGAAPMTSVNDIALLDERGREFYWEGWRREDLIRFGQFLKPWQEKATDDPKYLIFPIPSDQLAVNPNLEQNPGY